MYIYDFIRNSVIKITNQTVSFFFKRKVFFLSNFLPHDLNISVVVSVVLKWASVRMLFSYCEQNNTRTTCYPAGLYRIGETRKA
jgi:hypothetical protein